MATAQTPAATLVQFESGHADMVHDASFDYYGKRLATCSSDRSIKVFDVAGEQVRSQGRDRAEYASRRQAENPVPALFSRSR